MENFPIFIKIDDYKDVVEILARTREQVGQARQLLARIGEVKAHEDELLAQWAHEIEDVEHRIEEIDKMLVHQKMQ